MLYKIVLSNLTLRAVRRMEHVQNNILCISKYIFFTPTGKNFLFQFLIKFCYCREIDFEIAKFSKINYFRELADEFT